MSLDSLPNIVLESGFASQLEVAANGLHRMVKEGTLPAPFARKGDKPVWSEGRIVEFFGKIQPEQSAYAPLLLEEERNELEKLEAYVCSAVDSKRIGNRRPAYLALYRSGAPRNVDGFYEIEVYPVLWVQTQRGVAAEHLVVPEGVDNASVEMVPWSIVRPGAKGPLTLFKLDVSAKQMLPVKTGVRRGGTISTKTLLAALGANSEKASHFQGGVVHLID